jgi:hypothetical protein
MMMHGLENPKCKIWSFIFFYSGMMEIDIEILFNYKSVREQEGALS